MLKPEESPQAIGDAGLGQIVGGHFQADAIANSEADEMLAHFAGEVGEDFVLVIEPDSEHGSGEDRGDGAFKLDGLFAGQKSVSVMGLTIPRLVGEGADK